MARIKTEMKLKMRKSFWMKTTMKKKSWAQIRTLAQTKMKMRNKVNKNHKRNVNDVVSKINSIIVLLKCN